MSCLAPGLAVLLTFLVFRSSLSHEFVSWDDLRMFPDNPHYQGLGWPQLRWSWTTFHVGEYMPLTWMTYGADYLLWGLDPFGYHLTNLALHGLTVLVVYVLGVRLFGLAWAGRDAPPPMTRSAVVGVATLFFAIHPLRVEPVAWVSARGSILGGLLALLTILAYLQAHADVEARRAHPGWFLGSLGLFVLGLLARSTNVMLPFVLLVLDAYPLGRLGGGRGWSGAAWRLVREKVPFLALSGVVVLLAVRARAESEGVFGRAPTNVAAGLAAAAFGLARYVTQTFWPWGAVSPLNEMPSGLDPGEGRFLWSGAVVAAITLALLALRRRWPAALAAWVCYALLLLPTSGLVPFGSQLAADRYTYVSCLGFVYLAGGALLLMWRQRQRGSLGRPGWIAAVGLVAVTLAGFGVVSARRVEIWRDSQTLWTYTASVEPRAVIPHVSLGLVFERDGRLADAVAHFRQAAVLRPADARIRTDLGRALGRQGRLPEAVSELETAIRLAPGFTDAHLTLGGVLVAQDRLEEGLERYRTAARLHPDSAAVQYNMARVLVELGRLAEAVDHFRSALAIQPGFVEARANLELLLRQIGAPQRGGGV